MLYGPNQGGRGLSVLSSFIRDDPDLVFDTVGFQEDLAAVIVASLIDSIGVQETLTQTVSTILADSVGTQDAPIAILVIQVSTTDSFSFDESLLSAISVSLADFIGPQGAVTAVTIRITNLVDSIGAQEAATAITSLITLLADSLVVSDILLAGNERFIVVNAETGAFSTYTFPFAITGVGALNGTLYLTTTTGLYALDATNDAGAAIQWELRGGFSMLGSSKKKRVTDVLIEAEGDRVNLITVVETNTGRNEYHYGRDYGWAVLPRGRVVKVGRGLSSFLWQIGLYGSGVSRVFSITPTVESLTRRM